MQPKMEEGTDGVTWSINASGVEWILTQSCDNIFDLIRMYRMRPPQETNRNDGEVIVELVSSEVCRQVLQVWQKGSRERLGEVDIAYMPNIEMAVRRFWKCPGLA